MKRTQAGFTLVELLVVITIISILMGLLIPAVNAAREVARKMECGTKMTNLALAGMQHENTKGYFPGWIEKHGVFPGGADRSDLGNYAGAVPRHVKVSGYGVSLLPWLDAQPTYEHWTDDSYPVIADSNADLGTTIAVGASGAGIGYHTLAAPNLPNFICPSNPVADAQSGRNSYITNNGAATIRTAACATATGTGAASVITFLPSDSQRLNNGVFKARYIGVNISGSAIPSGYVTGPNVTLDDLKDGKTNTALFSENVQALPWHFAGFLNGGGPAPNLLTLNPTDTDLDWTAVNPTAPGEMTASQYSSGMVWHFEDPREPQLNALPTPPVSPQGAVLANDAFTIHRINGGGTVASEDIFTLQMNLARSIDLARPSSAHVDGVNMGFADGHMRYIADSIDYRVYQAMLTPRGKSSDVPWPEFVITDELGNE